MRSVSILSLAGLLALSAAQPAVKRDMVTVTEVKTIVKTIDVTSTVTAGDNVQATPSPVAQDPPASFQHHQHHSHHHAHPTSQDPPPPPPSSTTTSTPEPVTTPTPTPTPIESTTAAPPPTSTGSPSGGSGGAPANAYSGEMTFYTPGLGSCGITNTDTDLIVALAVPMMNNPANPNDNPLCGQKITIQYGGVTEVATVTDTCQACAMEDVDMTPTLFSKFASQSEGRVSGIKWWFNDASLMN